MPPRAMTFPAWQPQRLQPEHVEPGNPFGPGPNMQPPPYAPGGTFPSAAFTLPLTPWTGRQSQQFVSDGTNQVWTWESPVFDLRPGATAATGRGMEAVPINHEAALGQSVYLAVILGTDGGTVPPALTVFSSVVAFEDGHVAQPQQNQLVRLTQDVDITEQVYAGGTRTTSPVGASPLTFTPCIVGLQFWRLSIRLTIAGTTAITEPYFIMAALH